jgi:hypothetical protein
MRLQTGYISQNAEHKKRLQTYNPLILLVGREGFEPATHGLRVLKTSIIFQLVNAFYFPLNKKYGPLIINHLPTISHYTMRLAGGFK